MSNNAFEELNNWFKEINQISDYSFAKEFFAGIDSADASAFSMPFNSAALPVFLRLFDKYAKSPNWDELIEGLDLRYHYLYSQKILD